MRFSESLLSSFRHLMRIECWWYDVVGNQEERLMCVYKSFQQIMTTTKIVSQQNCFPTTMTVIVLLLLSLGNDDDKRQFINEKKERPNWITSAKGINFPGMNHVSFFNMSSTTFNTNFNHTFISHQHRDMREFRWESNEFWWEKDMSLVSWHEDIKTSRQIKRINEENDKDNLFWMESDMLWEKKVDIRVRVKLNQGILTRWVWESSCQLMNLCLHSMFPCLL